MLSIYFKGVLLGMLLFGAQSQGAPVTLVCDYQFTGVSMGTVKLELIDGLPSEIADVALFFAPSRQMPVTVNEAQQDQELNLSLSKDDPNNHIDMIVFKFSPGEAIQSKLVNHSVPIGKELLGTCGSISQY